MRKEIFKEIRICDICHREENYLQRCIVCGNEYCLVCQSTIPGCMITVNCCKICAERDDVDKIVRKYAKPLYKTVMKRDEELKNLINKV